MSKIPNPKFKEKLDSKTELRKIDFLENRIQGIETVDNEIHARAGSSGQPLTPAEYRIQQLLELRYREELLILEQQEERFGNLRNLRDLGIMGQRNWVPIGPSGVKKGQAYQQPVMSGRAKGIAVAPDGKRVYLATANGGVWYSPDGGHFWQPLMNGLNYFDTPSVPPFTSGSPQNITSLSCGAIALIPGTNQANDNLYVGTGEGDGMTDAYVGIGVLHSKNGGLSWENEASNVPLYGSGFYGIVYDPALPDNLVAATTFGIFRREAHGGGFRWNQQATATLRLRISGLAFAKAADGTAGYFAAEWGRQVHSSADGISWGPLGTQFPTNRIGRVALSVKPDEPKIVYAQIAYSGLPVGVSASLANPAEGHLHGIYRLDLNIDNIWRKANGVPPHLFGPDLTKHGQGDYDNAIIVSPDNANRIYIGGSTVWYKGSWVASLFRLDLNVTSNGNAMVMGTPETIGTNVHADVHGFAFTPGDSEKLWVACDGGLFFTDQAVSGTKYFFKSCNRGLQTLTMNYLGTHPTEEEVLFCGAQDNGGLRYTGEDVWMHSTPGDGGTFLINWFDTNIAIVNYHSNMFNRVTNGGNRKGNGDYDYAQTSVPVNTSTNSANHELYLFYSPVAQVSPPAAIDKNNDTHKRQGNLLAFGTQRPWISTDFGKNWFPLPSRRSSHDPSFISDKAIPGGSLISALLFLDSRRLLVGLKDGGVFKYTDNSSDNDWTVTGPVENLGAMPGGPLPPRVITDFAHRPGHPNEFFVCIGGIIGGANARRHVWQFDGIQWISREGTNPARRLLDVHCNAIIATDPDRIFVGTDVGVWASSAVGPDFFWDPFSFGLPETAITDLRLSTRDLESGQQLFLLRASTYGRGVFEYQLSPAPPPPAPGTSIDLELYLRDHYLDKGRYATRLNFPDPRDYSKNITSTDSPDIKLSRPNEHGFYQFMRDYDITPGEYFLELRDDYDDVPVPSAGKAITRVYVQIHNRSAFPALRVQVMLLAHALPDDTLPVLPEGYGDAVRAGKIIDSDGWKTVGIQREGGIHAAHPAIVAFDLSSEILPAHEDFGIFGGINYLLVAILHHPNDAYSTNIRTLNPDTDGNLLLSEEKKIAVKRIKLRRSNPIPLRSPNYVPLQGYIPIPATATEACGPFDAILANSFRNNDHILHNILASGFAAPFGSRGNVANPPAPHASDLVFADHLNIAAEVILREATPLIWRARQKITLSAKINGAGKGAPRDSDGDFGGSGGGSSSHTGKQCTLPQSNPPIEIASASVDNPGTNLDPIWASRAWLSLQYSKGAGAGGQSGADPGGIGGGIVVLCAPVIEFAAGGQIDVRGDQGLTNAGGGGGGLILLIAGEIIGLHADGPTQNILLSGGGSAGNGKSGGNGLLLQNIIN